MKKKLFKRSQADDWHYKIHSLEDASEHLRLQVAKTKTAFKTHDKSENQLQKH